jgi:cell division protein FtsW (lipid II flippase)
MGGSYMNITENQKVKEYISSICSLVKNNRVHDEIKKEFASHIEDLVLEYTSKGEDEESAIDKAINNMGDSQSLGKQLNKIHKSSAEWSIMLLSIIFSIVGLTALFFMQETEIFKSIYAGYDPLFFNKALKYFIIGLTAMIGMNFFDFRKLQAYSMYIYIGTLLTLLYVVIYGKTLNGANEWLSISFNGISFLIINFAQISPLLFIISFAGLLSNYKLKDLKKIYCAIVIWIAPILLMFQFRSKSIVIIYIIATIVLLGVSGLKLKYISISAIVCTVLSVWMYISEPYRFKFWFLFLNPSEDPVGGGWRYLQVKKAITSAGLLGNGFNFDLKTMFPEIQGEFIFAYIIYTFGWIAGIIIASLALVFLLRMIVVATRLKNSYGRLLVIGICTIFAIQFIWNIIMNFGIAPIAGIGLPFISYGNSQFVINMIAIGLISSIYKFKNIKENMLEC